MSTEDIMKRLRGPKGSEVHLTIVRRNVGDPLPFTVKRDKMPIYSLDAAYLIQPGTATSASTASAPPRPTSLPTP